jgi:hypothetical protein
MYITNLFNLYLMFSREFFYVGAPLCETMVQNHTSICDGNCLTI